MSLGLTKIGKKIIKYGTRVKYVLLILQEQLFFCKFWLSNDYYSQFHLHPALRVYTKNDTHVKI